MENKSAEHPEKEQNIDISETVLTETDNNDIPDGEKPKFSRKEKILISTIAAVGVIGIAVFAVAFATGAFTQSDRKATEQEFSDSSLNESSDAVSEAPATSSYVSEEQSGLAADESGDNKDDGNSGIVLSAITRPARYIHGGTITQEMINNSRLIEGNKVRLSAKINQLEKGGSFTVGFIGGSITQGFFADDGQSYADLTAKWFSDTFPKAKISAVNAGIGATGSYLGVHRMDTDLLAKAPDIVFVEYAVNDNGSSRDIKALDSMLIRIWNSEKSPAIILLGTVTKTGSTSQSAQSNVASHYNLPMISYGDTIMAEIKNRTISWSDISPDDIHPNNVGHNIFSQLITAYLTDVINSRNSINGSASDFSTAATDARYRNASWCGPANTTPLNSSGFTAVTDKTFGGFKGYWEAATVGAELSFNVTAKNIGIANGMMTSNSGTAEVFVDGKSVYQLDGKTTFDYVIGNEVAEGLNSGSHTVKIVVKSGTVRISGILIS